jgi:FKBP-type peptidyl-prolyl cis-trans isomerase SlyD
MENQLNKLIAVAYKLYTVEGEDEQLVEEATDEHPFQFISGLGITLEDFEKTLIDIEKGNEFEIILKPDKAYGNYEKERVVNLDKEMFYINGHFDHENIYKGAIIPLQNEDGNHFMGHVLDITDENVLIDLNHPLAGKTLKFKGHVLDSHEATNEEIQHFINIISGEHQCGDCEKCGGCDNECHENDGHYCNN